MFSLGGVKLLQVRNVQIIIRQYRIIIIYGNQSDYKNIIEFMEMFSSEIVMYFINYGK